MMRGIDGQVMINKTVDYSRQMSNQMHEIEHNKQFAAELQKSKVVLENNSVNQTREAEDSRVAREKNEMDDGSGRRKKRRGRGAAEDAEELEIEMTAEEEVMSRVPRQLSKNERGLGGSIDLSI